MIARRAVVAGTAFLSLLTTGAAAPVPPAATSAPGAAKSIAHRIHTGTLEEATAAMSEAFAWAGVSIVDAQGKSVAKGIAPTIPVTMRSFEMRKAAIAARGEPTTDVGDLAQLLADLGGFQGDGSPDDAAPDLAKLMESGEEITEADLARLATGITKQIAAAESAIDGELAGIVFVDILGEMIRASRTAPKSAHNFVPLLIEALAKERGALDPGGLPLDLASGKAHPEDVRLTLAEAELFVLMINRPEKSLAELPVRYASLDMPIVAAPPSARGGTACADLLDAADDYAKSALPHAADTMGGGAVDTFYEWMKKKTGFAHANALKIVVGYAYKAIRLLTWLLDSSEFTVTPTPTDGHYSHHDDKEVEITLKAEVELPSGGDGAGAEAASCLNTFFGFNLPDSPAALAKSMKDWRVYWDFGKLGEHGSVSSKNKFKFHTQLGNGLEVSGTKGTSEVIVDLAHEEQKADARGEQKKGVMRVKASLDQSAAFDPTLLFKGGKAGAGAGAAETRAGATLIVADVLIDVLIEWAKKVFPRTAEASVNVTWHEPKVFAWEGTITQVTNLSAASDTTKKVPGRAPPAIAVGVSIGAPGPGKELFHYEDTETRTFTVTVKPGRDGQRIHPYKASSEKHEKSTRKETTPESCMVDDGATWKVGTWTTDFLETLDYDLSGWGYTTVDVKFNEDGTYYIETKIPRVSGGLEAKSKYIGESSCTGEPDPENRPLVTIAKAWKDGPFTVTARGRATADAKVLSDSIIEPVKADGVNGSKGTITTTWKLKKVELK